MLAQNMRIFPHIPSAQTMPSSLKNPSISSRDIITISECLYTFPLNNSWRSSRPSSPIKHFFIDQLSSLNLSFILPGPEKLVEGHAQGAADVHAQPDSGVIVPLLDGHHGLPRHAHPVRQLLLGEPLGGPCGLHLKIFAQAITSMPLVYTISFKKSSIYYKKILIIYIQG
jgi:hypothetical protein